MSLKHLYADALLGISVIQGMVKLTFVTTRSDHSRQETNFLQEETLCLTMPPGAALAAANFLKQAVEGAVSAGSIQVAKGPDETVQ